MFLYYSRISTIGQNSSRQIENFRQHGGLDANNVFIDKCSGKIPFFERPEAIRLYETATSQPKDVEVTIVIDDISRLGRSLKDILTTIEVFTDNKICLKSLKEGFETLTNGKINPVAQIVIGVIGSISEFMRLRTLEISAEGIAVAKAAGKYKGRKVGSFQTKERLLQRYPIVVNKLKKGLSVRDVALLTNHSTTTIMKVRKALGIES